MDLQNESTFLRISYTIPASLLNIYFGEASKSGEQNGLLTWSVGGVSGLRMRFWEHFVTKEIYFKTFI